MPAQSSQSVITQLTIDASGAAAGAAQYDAAMTKAEEATNRLFAANDNVERAIGNATRSMNDQAGSAGNLAAIILGLAGTLTAFVAQMISVNDALSKIGDRSEEIRLPVNMLQALSVSADMARMSQSDLSKEIDNFTKVSKQSADDAEKFYKALNNVGSGFTTAYRAATSQPERLRVIMDALGSTTNEVKRAQLAIEAFGTDSTKTLEVFGNGRAGLDAANTKMRELGLNIDESVIPAAQKARSELNLLGRVISDDAASALAGLIPILAPLVTFFERIAVAANNLVAAFMLLDSQKPTAVLTNEKTVLSKEMDDLLAERDRLTSDSPTQSDVIRNNIRKTIDNIFGTDLSDADKNIAGIDKRISEIKKREAEIDDLLKNRSQGGSTEPPAFQPRSSLSDSSRSSIDALDQRMQKNVDLLDLQANGVGKTAQAYQEMKAAYDLNIAALKDGKKPTEEQIAHFKDLADKTADATLRLREFTALQSEQFKSATMFMSPAEQAAAQIAHQIDPTNWQAHMSDLAAQTAAFNSEIGQARDLTVNFFQAFNNDIINGAVSMSTLTNAVKGLANSLLEMAEKNLVNAAFGGLFGVGGGNIFSSIGRHLFGLKDGGSFTVPAGPGALALPGFANGTDFTVPGSGPPDSKVTAFRVSPGERVTVTPPGRGGSASQPFIYQDNRSYDFRGADPGSEARIKGYIDQQNKQTLAAIPQIVARTYANTPRFLVGK